MSRCKRCEELREYLNKYGLCIFCIKETTNPSVEGFEVKEVKIVVKGTEIKSKTGKVNENMLYS